MKKYKIIYDRTNCIGIASCVVFSKRFKMADDDKADLVGSKEEKEMFVLEIEEDELEEVLESARVCPVNVIHVYDLETNEKLI